MAARRPAYRYKKIDSMKIQSFLYSRIASGLAIFLSQILPAKVGYPFAEWLGRTIGTLRGTEHERAVRANQWVISRKKYTSRELDRATEAVFRFAGYALYDFYHQLARPDAILKKVSFSPRLQEFLDHRQEAGQGVLFVVPHMGSFDLAGRALAMCGLPFQILSYPQPPNGYKLQNKIRAIPGVEVTPMSINAMRRAVERLRKGGLVLTGLDRPIANANYHPRFFRIPADLPVTHVRLALKVNVPIIVAAVIRNSTGNYLVDISEPIHMKPDPDLKTEMENNAEIVLSCAERFILRAPQQWLMYYPVWPTALQEMP